MLEDYLRKAIELKADSLEIEYEDRKECFTAFRGNIGFGIGAVDSEESDAPSKNWRVCREPNASSCQG